LQSKAFSKLEGKDLVMFHISHIFKKFLAFERSNMRSLEVKNFPTSLSFFSDQIHLHPQNRGEKSSDLLLSVAPRLHLSRLSCARGVDSFFFLRHGPTRRKGWFVDLTSRTMGASLTYRTRTQDVGSSGCPYAADSLPWPPIDAHRPTIDHHEFTMNLVRGKMFGGTISFLISYRFDAVIPSYIDFCLSTRTLYDDTK